MTAERSTSVTDNSSLHFDLQNRSVRLQLISILGLGKVPNYISEDFLFPLSHKSQTDLESGDLTVVKDLKYEYQFSLLMHFPNTRTVQRRSSVSISLALNVVVLVSALFVVPSSSCPRPFAFDC